VCAASSTRINRLLADWGHGNEEAREALIPVVYDELRRVARRHLWRERPDHTLQSAALVNEAYLRLVRQHAPQWQNRAHFFGVAAEMMRHILVDHARLLSAAPERLGWHSIPKLPPFRNRKLISSHSTMPSASSPL
jgi:RNA polymerase sigma factor (TIGR02999 family)